MDRMTVQQVLELLWVNGHESGSGSLGISSMSIGEALKILDTTHEEAMQSAYLKGYNEGYRSGVNGGVD